MFCITDQCIQIWQAFFVIFYFVPVGAGGGIGRQLALEFAAHGAKLVLWDINKGAKNNLFVKILKKTFTAFNFNFNKHN